MRYGLLEYVVSRLQGSDESIAHIADKAGVKPRWLRYVASGETKNPRVLDLELVATYFRKQETKRAA